MVDQAGSTRPFCPGGTAPASIPHNQSPPWCSHSGPCGGEHNVEVLTELGLTPAQIAALEAAGGLVRPVRWQVTGAYYGP